MKFRCSLLEKLFLSVSLLVCLLYSAAAVEAGENRSRRILMIDSYSSADPWSEDLAHGFREALNEKNISAIYEVYQLGVRNQPGIRASEGDVRTLLHKLNTTKYDLVVASSNDAADLFLDGSVKIPDETPLLVMGYIGEITPEQQQKFNMTGVVVPFQPYRNVQLALQLVPQLKKIVFVVEASSEGAAAQKNLTRMRNLLPENFSILYGADYTTEELLTKIAALPRESVLLFYSWSSSREEFPENSMTALPRIRKVFPGLILGRFDRYIPLGSAGGCVASGSDQGRQAGAIAVDILQGARAEEIPAQSGKLETVFDYAALKQHGITLDKVPSGVRLINQPEGFITRHQQEIMIGMLALLLMLIPFYLYLFARRRMHKRLLELLNGLPARIGVVDQAGRFLYIHMADYVDTGKHIKKISDLPGEYRDLFAGAVRSVFEGEEKVELDYSSEGRCRHAGFFRLPDPNAFNTPAVIWLSWDQTDLKQAHQEIARMADRFRLTLESIGDGVIATDENERVTLLNPAAAQLTGYTPEQAIGKKMDEIFNIVSYIDGSKVASPLTRALESGRTVELANHTDLIALDGSRRHIADSASPLCAEDGRIIGGVLVFRDVTREYEQRDWLRMNGTILDTVGKVAKFSYFHRHADGSFPVQSLLTDNWPLRDGRPVPEEEWINAEDLPEFKEAWRQLLAGESKSLHVKYTVGTGKDKCFYEMRAVPSFNEITRRPDFFGVIQDITEARRDECRYRDNLRLLQTILDNLPGYIFVKDVNDNFRNILCNRGLGDLLGLDSRTLIGKFDYEFFPRDEAAVQKFHDDDMALVQSGKMLELRESFVNAQGKKMVVHTIKNVFRQSDDTHLLIGLGFDITRQSQLEEEQSRAIAELEALSQNERIVNQSLKMILLENDFPSAVNKMLRIIGENADADRSYIFRYEGSDQHYSSNEYEWVRDGIAPEKDILQHVDMTGLGKWNDILLSKREIIIGDLANAPEELTDAKNILMPQSIKSLLVCGIWMGDKLWGYVGLDFVRRHHDFNANDIHMVHNIVNLFLLARERGTQFNRIADSMSLQKQIMDNINIPILLVDLDYKVRAANPSKKINVNLPVEQVLGSNCFDTVCKCGSPPEFCAAKETMITQQAASKEFSIDGKRLISNAQPIFDRNGKMQYVLTVDIDITEVTRQKEELKVAMEQAQAADRAKSYFLATMSHELRTPLNAVIGFSELLQNNDVPLDEQQEYLQSINCAGTALLNLINDILDLSKLEADLLPFTPSRTDVSELIAEVASVFRLKTKEKHIELRVDSAKMGYPVFVDNLRLRQILLNLIGNAIKFTHKGFVSVEAEFIPSGVDATGTLNIRVSDTGIGISAKDAVRIFDPFVQSESTRGNRVYEGSGLGLAISQRLAQRMGGKIELTSTPNVGSCFHICLKSIGFEEGVAENARQALPLDASLESRNLRVLLVDDVPLNLKVLEAMLKKLKIESTCVNSGQEALNILQKDRRFDLIFTDIWMPGMSGMELARRLHADLPECTIPLVAVTADTQFSTDMPEMFKGVLLKPITQETLQAVIAAVRETA